MNLAVIGLGKLGLPLAALQAKNHNVIGVDTNINAVNLINSGYSPIKEPGLDELLKSVVQRGHLRATDDMAEIAGTDISLVIVPTPSLKSGRFTSRYVLQAVADIGDAIKDQPNRHVVVICSTVMPGECDGPISLTLEDHSGKTVGEDVGLVYSPEFIALGTVIRDMENPSVTLIGESDPISGADYSRLVPQDAPIRYMSLTSAELAKIALNAYVTNKISFANTIGEICENTVDADAFAILDAIGLDPRVGSSYIRPGGPFGGPCFPRDNRAFAAVGQDAGLGMELALATDKVNDRQIQRTISHIKKHERKRVGILGFTYKPGTQIYEESFGLNLAKQLIFEGYDVAVYDPLLRSKPEGVPEEIVWCAIPEPCFGSTTTTVITSPDKEIAKIFPEIFSTEQRISSVVIDCWGIVPPSPWDQTHIVKLGRGEQCY
jgi:UDPglucose 6-dehydrogenase